ncbi:MAG: HIRAN domain-containing protein [Candidatus Methylumidiphilus sp.]
MNTLQYIIEPKRLWLTWQPPDEYASARTRRIVGELCHEDCGEVVFRYLRDSPDFNAAKLAGFKRFPAFPLHGDEIRQGVVEALMRRLPPRKREDFAEYLTQHGLPAHFQHSDFALLGYTGARLPSDGFALVPEFPPDAVPCDYLTEVVGVRHVFNGEISLISVGDPVLFVADKDNSIDSDALAIVCKGDKIGYVNRALRHTVQSWLDSHKVDASIHRLNGKPERPLVYVKICVS